MRNSFQIGRIFGISIRIDYSWFIIFAMLLWSLSTHYFPEMYRWRTLSTYWIMGFITAIAFFMSILAHELAHSLVSKAKGVSVESITLFIFGGVAQVTDEPRKPSNEFWMALSGPLTSLALAGIFGAFYLSLRYVATPVRAMFAWLTGINMSVAIFNLIPGFPLDGGRLLRAIVWKITGDLRKSTRVASIVGRVVAYLFVFWGLWRLFYGDWIGGVWIAFIGWFLDRAATSSYRQLALKELMQAIKVKDVMIRECRSLPKELTIRELVDGYIFHTSFQCFPVVDNNVVLGIITIQEIKQIPREQWSFVTVEDAMIPLEKMKSVKPDDDLFTVLQKMNSDNVSQLPVVENDQLIGLISRDSLINAINIKSELG